MCVGECVERRQDRPYNSRACRTWGDAGSGARRNTMAYIPGYKYDVFISYAHFDNEADTQDICWVSRFQTDLKKALRQRLGAEPEIFFDSRNLHAHHEIH